jgi:hypothetical protein
MIAIPIKIFADQFAIGFEELINKRPFLPNLDFRHPFIPPSDSYRKL